LARGDAVVALVVVPAGGGAGAKKTEAEPWLALAPTASRNAPATIVPPSMATETPNVSIAAPSLAVSLAVWAPARVKV
jgi:hypothetical protein